jgi:hypothetical protein
LLDGERKISGIISNAEERLSEFCIQSSEENINIFLRQIRVSKTNLDHTLLIRNEKRKTI